MRISARQLILVYIEVNAYVRDVTHRNSNLRASNIQQSKFVMTACCKSKIANMHGQQCSIDRTCGVPALSACSGQSAQGMATFANFTMKHYQPYGTYYLVQ